MLTPPPHPAPLGVLNPPLQGEINDGGSTAGVTGVGGSPTNPGVAGDGGSVGVAGFSRVGVGVIGNAPLAQRFQAHLNFQGVPIGGTLQGPFGFLGGRDPVFNQLAGVYGQSDQQGVMGLSTSATGTGVYGGGTGPNGGGGIGVRGETSSGVGVQGQSFGSGAFGFLAGSDPVFKLDAGVYGQSGHQGVMGLSTSADGTGVYGGSTSPGGGSGIGVRGETSSGVGVQGQSFGSGLAGKFIGNLEVTGDIQLINADCAEDFDIAGLEVVDPGAVMVLDGDGRTRECSEAYDNCVVGVVSGGGDCKPGIVLDRRQTEYQRAPIALLGKVYCKVDADYAGITVGDLLTSSQTPGHAMKADNPLRAFGAVIGKALRPLKAGRGMIPILIALQ